MRIYCSICRENFEEDEDHSIGKYPSGWLLLKIKNPQNKKWPFLIEMLCPDHVKEIHSEFIF